MSSGEQRALAFLQGLSVEEADEVLAHMPEEQRVRLERELGRGSDERLFAALEPLPPEALAAFLQMQHPQVAVTILRELPPETTEPALHEMFPSYRRDVHARMRASQRPPSDVLRLLDHVVTSHCMMEHGT